MRRARPQQPAEALASVAAMMRAGLGLRLLLSRLPPGATLEEARRARERILQIGRRRSPLLDGVCGIERA